MTRGQQTRWLAGLMAALIAVQLIVRVPAYADNCSVFTDCFGQANTAGEAAFGLLLLSILSLVLDFVPVVGTAKGVLESITGRDLLTGEKLELWERALGLVPFGRLGKLGRLGELGDDLAVIGRHGDDLAGVSRGADDLAGIGRGGEDLAGAGRVEDDLAGAGRAGKDVAGTGRVGDDVAGTGRAGDAGRGEQTPPRQLINPGDAVPLDPRHQTLVDSYRGANTTGRKAASERLGELGGLQYLQDATGRADLPLLRPRADADVAGFADLTPDLPWDGAVAFNGSRVTNIAYWDGKTLHIVEAKGGSSAYGDRAVHHLPPTASGRISQTDPDYPLDVAGDMTTSSKTDGRNEIGQAILDAAAEGRLEYVGVRTGSRTDILEGNAVVTLEGVFRRPRP